MAEDKKSMPPWRQPVDAGRSDDLMIYNSLTKSKVKYVPQGRTVGWYICGPTVYDSSHMGHARNYVTFDIIRRILEDYFHYNIYCVMNITDIDDKIILRARRNHLFEKYQSEHPTLGQDTLDLLKAAWEVHIVKLVKKEADLKKDLDAELAAKPASAQEPSKREIELTAEHSLSVEKLAAARAAFAALDPPPLNAPSGPFLEAAKDPLSEKLDEQFGASLDRELIKELVRSHSAKYEQEFLEDMVQLNVRMPTALPRVSEYVQEIVDYIQQIIDNKYAYAVPSGSVYFDTTTFNKPPERHYPKLEPTNLGNAKLFAEGEGALASGKVEEKRSSNDFALWKASKSGEPVWNSPWGLGRPGWHIECSVMANAHLDKNFDFHCGGEDLRFPHHDNEIAQSEAYHKIDQWVNYFLHAGHLHINGLKMSKSLKNFITIRQCLENYSPRQVRLLCLLHHWDKVMNFATSSMTEVLNKEKSFNEFFLAVKSAQRERNAAANVGHVPEKWVQQDHDLFNFLSQKRDEVHQALLDNFDTPKVIKLLGDLVRKTNDYMANNKARKAWLVGNVASYVSYILGVFGLTGWGGESSSEGAVVGNKETLLTPYVQALVDFRTKIRELAKVNPPADKKDYLALTDLVREDVMPPLGVRIRDDIKVGLGFDFVDPLELLREKKQAEKQTKVKALEKAKSKKNLLDADVKRWKTNSQDPKATVDPALYSKFDENGLPTHDKDGKELSKGARNKFTTQLKAYNKYLEETKKDSQFLEKLQAELERLEAEVKSLETELRAL